MATVASRVARAARGMATAAARMASATRGIATAGACMAAATSWMARAAARVARVGDNVHEAQRWKGDSPGVFFSQAPQICKEK